MDHYCHSRRELTPTSWQRRGTFDKLSAYRKTRKWLVGGRQQYKEQSQGDDENQGRKIQEIEMLHMLIFS